MFDRVSLVGAVVRTPCSIRVPSDHARSRDAAIKQAHAALAVSEAPGIDACGTSAVPSPRVSDRIIEE